MYTRRSFLEIASATATLALAGGAQRDAYAQAAAPALDRIVALVRSQPGIDPKLRPVQKIEAVVMKPEAGVLPDDVPVFDHFVGDLHLRYVFDDPKFMQGLRTGDLKKLRIDRAKLPALVFRNFRRLYPDLTVRRPEPSLGVLAKGGGLEPCMMLDSTFWERERAQYRGDLIAAVPARDLVMFTAREPRQNVELLKHLVVNMYEKAGPKAVSRTVFLWRLFRWEVLG